MLLVCTLQVTVGEGETEDQAVRRYMRAVVQSGVLTKVSV
jgi:ribosomal protein S21